MADIEQAAVGAEAEPGELGPEGRPRLPNVPRLILDQLALLPPLPAAARELPRRVRRDLAANAAAYFYGVRSAVVVAVLGWLFAAALVLALWATAAPAGSDPGVPLRVSGQLWLAAHHVLLHATDGPFGLSPLGFTLLPVLGLYAAGRRTARQAPGYALRASGGAALGYGLCACAVAAGSAGDGLRPEYTQVLLYPALIALFGHAAGAAGAIRGLLPQAEARWVPAAGRALLVALCIYLAAAGLLAAGFIISHADVLYVTQRQIGGGMAGEIGLFLVDLSLVPNAVLWVIAVFAGPGFALGTGTSVSLFSVVRGSLPGLPLLAATPDAQHPASGWLLLFLVPAAAGAGAAAMIGRRIATWPDRATATAATAGAGGITLAIAEMYAGGPVAFGPMSVVGSTAWLVGALVSVELLVGCGAAFGLWHAAPRVARRLSAYVPRPNTATGPGVPEPVGGGVVAPVEIVDFADLIEPVGTVDPPESVAHDDGVADHVGEGPVPGVPERGEVADPDLEDVGETADEGAAEADDLAVGLPDEPDLEGLLPDALPGGAGPVEVPQADAEGVDEADGQGGESGAGDAAAGGAGVGVDGDRLDAADVDDQADPVGDQQGDVVDQPGAEPLPPGGVGP
jgi:hypothetical protein